MALKTVEINANEYNETWNAKGALKAGDSIKGVYKNKRTFTTKYGEAVVFVIETENGAKDVIGQTDIRNKMAEVPENAYVEITYVGLVETKNGTMKEYKVAYEA